MELCDRMHKGIRRVRSLLCERITERFHGKGAFAQVTLHPERLELPLRWRKPRRVFVNSMADLRVREFPVVSS